MEIFSFFCRVEEQLIKMFNYSLIFRENILNIIIIEKTFHESGITIYTEKKYYLVLTQKYALHASIHIFLQKIKLSLWEDKQLVQFVKWVHK